MRILGIVMTVFGLAWAIFALNMDVNVTTQARTFGVGEYSVGVPSIDVVNVGLMDRRRNHLIFSGFIFLAGIILISVGKDSVVSKSRVCPFCAEKINDAAVLCRFCQKEIPSVARDITVVASSSSEQKQPNGPLTFVHCKKCTTLNEGTANVCFRCQHPFERG